MTTRNNFKPLDVTEVAEKVCLFLDQALSFEDARIVEQLVDSNPLYKEIYNQEQAYRQLIKQKFQPKKISTSFLQDIKSQISTL